MFNIDQFQRTNIHTSDTTQLISAQQVILFHHFRKLLEHAREMHIDVAPLKGAHLLTSVYPASESRGAMVDIDFLVQEHDWHRIPLLMNACGFSPVFIPSRHATQAKFHEAHYVHRFDAQTQIVFEPHRQFVQLARHPIDYSQVWQRSYQSTFEGVSCLRICDDDHFLHQVIHLFSHRFAEPVRGLKDMEMLWRNGDVNFSNVSRRAGEWKCRNALWLSLVLHKHIFATNSFDSLIEETMPSRFIRFALTKLVSPEHGFRFTGAGLRIEEATLWPFLMDDIHQGIGFMADYAKLRLKDLFSD
ncbi:MAG: nucleotidyltransferase family protein [Deltaproteobacteria bacterium]|nr:nucleotidyltransferase family protein [Deltaproteobacteria bacterium]